VYCEVQIQVYTQVSGSIGGITYAHAKGGTMYSRARAIPVNPATANQTLVRNAMTVLANAWGSLLTGPQRDSWDMYALNVPVTNPLGDSILLSGQNWFVGSNVLALQGQAKLGAGLALAQTGPVTFNRGDFTLPTAVTYNVAAGLSLSFTNTDDWANEDEAAMLVFQGLPRSQSTKFFKGPWRLVGAIEGDSITPPTSPFTVSAANLTSLGFTVSLSELVSTAVVVLRADGRYTSRAVLPGDIVGP